MEENKQQWMLVSEVASELRVNIKTVRRWLKSGKLVAFRASRGSEYRISRADFNNFVEANKTASSE